MLTLSSKGIYGLTAVLELARGRDGQPVQIKDIASTHDIPQHYLEQLLVVLKKGGIVDSFRGSQGGYTLARPPERITVLEVLSCLDGKLEVVAESKKSGPLSFFWAELEASIRNSLSKTLEELLAEKQSLEKQFVYHI